MVNVSNQSKALHSTYSADFGRMWANARRISFLLLSFESCRQSCSSISLLFRTQFLSFVHQSTEEPISFSSTCDCPGKDSKEEVAGWFRKGIDENVVHSRLRQNELEAPIDIDLMWCSLLSPGNHRFDCIRHLQKSWLELIIHIWSLGSWSESTTFSDAYCLRVIHTLLAECLQ